MFKKLNDTQLHNLIGEITQKQMKLQDQVTEIKTGIIKEEDQIKRQTEPITRLLQSGLFGEVEKTLESGKTVKSIQPLLKTIEEEFIKQQSPNNLIQSILTEIQTNSTNEIEVLNELKNNMKNINTTNSDISKFIRIIATTTQIREDAIDILNELKEDHTNEFIELSNVTEQLNKEFILLNKNPTINKKKINIIEKELINIEKQKDQSIQDLSNIEEDIEFLKSEETPELKETPELEETQELDDDEQIIAFDKNKFNMDLENANIFESDKGDDDIQNIDIILDKIINKELKFNYKKGVTDDKLTAKDIIPTHIQDVGSNNMGYFTLLNKIFRYDIENSKFRIGEIAYHPNFKKVYFRPVSDGIDDNTLDLFINSSKSKGFNINKFNKLSLTQQNKIIDIFDYSDIDEYDFSKSTVNSQKGILLNKFGNLINNLAKEKKGSAIPQQIFNKTNKFTQLKNHPYKILNNMFGDLFIDENKLKNFNLLKIKRGGQTLIKQKVNNDLVDLLTKRFNSRKNYNIDSLEMFKKIIEMANIPINRNSAKLKVVKNIKKGSNIDIKIFDSPKDMIIRMSAIIGAISAGNTSYILRNEFRQIIDKLLSKNIIKTSEHKWLTNKYNL